MSVVRRARAVKCPVCGGSGYLDNYDGTTLKKIPCHGCNGKGWVTVYDEVFYEDNKPDDIKPNFKPLQG